MIFYAQERLAGLLPQGETIGATYTATAFEGAGAVTGISRDGAVKRAESLAS